jgi:hypothetical protein
MKLSIRKFLKFLAIVTVATFSFVQQASATSYYSSAVFSVSLRGATRSYVGNDISVSLTGASCSGCVPAIYYVSLWRNVSFGSDVKIATVQCPRSADCFKIWTNLGSGNYYFYFDRAADGGQQTISTVHMYSN